MTRIKWIFLASLFVLECTAIQAQTYPVSASLQAIPPSSAYLSDYAIPSPNRLQAMLVLLDENELDIDVQLNMIIEGNGIRLATDPNAGLPVINLKPGPNMFSGHDLVDYLDPENMIISGMDPALLLQGEPLPEGMYTFCLEVTDYLRTDKLLAPQACAMVNIQLNNPPTITNPTCGSTVRYNEQQNIPIEWHINHDPAIRASYKVNLVHVPKGMDPNEAMLGTDMKLLEDYETSMTSLLYGVDFPELDYGERYALRVDVVDATGQTSFENDGIGQVCAFDYATDSISILSDLSPEDDAVLSKDNLPFFSWSGPNKVQDGAQVHYRITIVQVEDGQSAKEAIRDNNPVHLQETQIVSQLKNWSEVVNASLNTETTYAWRVEALIGSQEIATSRAQVFRTSPLIDHFVAAGKHVRIVTTDNDDYSNLSGKGQVQLEENGKWYDIEFSNVNVEHFEATNILQGGKIVSAIKEELSIDVDLGNEGEADFDVSHILLDAQNLKLRGELAWRFPLAALSDNGPAELNSEPHDVLFNTYQLEGEVNLQAENLQLIDPGGFEMKIDSSSTISLSLQKNTLDLDGHVTLPESHKTENDQRVRIPFENISTPLYFESNSTRNAPVIDAHELMHFGLQPQSVVFDFSLDQSPGQLVDDASWMGVYLKTGTITVDDFNDSEHHIDLFETVSFQFDINNDATAECWIDDKGLDLNMSLQRDQSQSSVLTFNQFDGNFVALTIDIENNELQDGHIKGDIDIPLLGADKHEFTVNFHADGYAPGHLDQEIRDLAVQLNTTESGQSNVLYVNHASFVDADHLAFSARIKFANIRLEGTTDAISLSNMNLYGDGQLTINDTEEMVPLPSAYQAKLEAMDFSIQIDSIAVSRFENQYLFAASYAIPLGTEVTTADGEAPRSYLVSSAHDEQTDHSKHHDDHHDDHHHKDDHISPTWLTIMGKDVATGSPDIKLSLPPLSIDFGVGFIDIPKFGFVIHEKYGGCFEAEGKVLFSNLIPKVGGGEIGIHVIIGAKKDYSYVYGNLVLGKINQFELEANSRLKRFVNDNNHGVYDGSNSNFQLGPISFKSVNLCLFINMKRSLDHDSGKMLILPEKNSYGGGGLIGIGLNKGANDDAFRLTVGGDLVFNTVSGLEHVHGYVGLITGLHTLEFKASGEVDVDLVDKYLFIAGEFEMEKPWCLEGEGEYEKSWGDHKAEALKIGTYDNPLLVVFLPQGDPCVGFTGHAYVIIMEEFLQFGIGVGFQAKWGDQDTWYGIPDAVEVNIIAKLLIYGMLDVKLDWSHDTQTTGAYVGIRSKGSLDLSLGVRLLGDDNKRASVELVHMDYQLRGWLEIPAFGSKKEFKFDADFIFHAKVLLFEFDGAINAHSAVDDPFSGYRGHKNEDKKDKEHKD